MPHLLTQRFNDCGVCAVANLMNLSWADAAERIFGEKYDNKLRYNSTTKQIVSALGYLSAGLIRVNTWGEIPHASIVKVIAPEQEDSGNWHWVCWKNDWIIDSNCRYKFKPREYDCGRLVSYIGPK